MTDCLNFRLQAITHYSVERQVTETNVLTIFEDHLYHFDWSSSTITPTLILLEEQNI